MLASFVFLAIVTMAVAVEVESNGGAADLLAGGRGGGMESRPM